MCQIKSLKWRSKDNFSSLKLAIMSGSACPPDLMRWFQGKVPRCAVTQLWGMTETTGALYTRPGDSIDIAANSAGQPSPGTEIRVVDGEGRVCEAEETGELQVCGCLLFPGFFDNDAANQTAFTADRWYRTGDLAKRNAGGNVAITLCEKDIINRGGVNSIRAIWKTCSTRTRRSCNRQLCQCRTRYWGSAPAVSSPCAPTRRR